MLPCANIPVAWRNKQTTLVNGALKVHRGQTNCSQKSIQYYKTPKMVGFCVIP